MGWQDRDYGNDGRGGGMNPLMNILFGSVPLGTWFGIRVRVHASLILMLVFNLLFSRATGGMGVQHALTSSVIVFGIVLLHEFGHCVGCRMVGGRAEDILLWPLGGLAMVDPPRRPWPSFVSTAGGPLVNVIIGVVCGLALEIAHGFKMPLPLNPLLTFSSGKAIDESGAWAYYWMHGRSSWEYYVLWIYTVNWTILAFNLLPIFPFDGGRMLQEILWPIIGFVRSMKFACITGIVGGVMLGMVGLTGSFMLVFLAFFGILTCYQTLMMVKSGAIEEYGEPDYAASLWQEHGKRRKVKKGWFNSARKKAKQEAAEQAKIDAILAKVHEKGLHSLTWWEKRTLKKATERQRQRDLAERL